jgi:hypothetical protein
MNIFERGLCVLQCRVCSVPQMMFIQPLMLSPSIFMLLFSPRPSLLARPIWKPCHLVCRMSFIMGQQPSFR